MGRFALDRLALLKETRRIYSFFMDSFQTITLSRTIGALGVALASLASTLSLVFSHTPFVTMPVELLGSFAYYTNMNITNRLSAITLSMLVSLLVFLVFMVFFYIMKDREHEALSVVGYCLLPVLFWLSTIIFLPQSAFDIFWLHLSTTLCWIALLSFLRERKSERQEGITKVLLITFALSFFVAPAILVFLKSPLFLKLPIFEQPQQIQESFSQLGLLVSKMQWLVPTFVLLLWVFLPSRTVLLRFVLYPIQVFLLLFFCLILPGTFLVDENPVQYFSAKLAFFIIVLPLFVAGTWDILRRYFGQPSSHFFSYFACFALLIYFFFQTSPLPGISSNNFELGARLPGFSASYDGQASLFKDVYLAFGLWDYVSFLFGWFFTGLHTVGSTAYGIFLFRVFILGLEFFAVSCFLPIGLAFLLCLIAGSGSNSIILIFLSILLCPHILNRPAVWIVSWISLSVLLPFVRIPQGTVCVLASLPAFLWQATKLFIQDYKAFQRIVAFLGVMGFAITIWPFGSYFGGLVRMLSETARVNSAWAADSWKIDTVPLLQALLGNFLLVMPLISFVIALVILKNGSKEFKFFIAFFLCSFCVIYSFASIGYAFSRTGGVAYIRQFNVGITLLFPLLASVIAYAPSNMVKGCCLGVLLCFVGLMQRTVSSPASFVQQAQTFPMADKNVRDAADFGLPNLGVGVYSLDYLEEESTLKQTLDRVLGPDETFLDLTMDGLHYFNSQRTMVTEYPVYFIYPGDTPQLRAIESLNAHNVEVTLLEPTYFDESPSSLRTYYLYRYAVLRGLPLEITSTKTLLLPQEYFTRLGLTPPDSTQTLKLLDKQFPMTDFSYIPGVWGRGYADFVKDLRLIVELPTQTGELNERLSMRWNLQTPVRGVDAGLLVLNIGIPKDSDVSVKIQWIDSTLPNEDNHIEFKPLNGINIVPLDASPRWLLAHSIAEITLSTSSHFSIYISEASLSQRMHIDDDLHPPSK